MTEQSVDIPIRPARRISLSPRDLWEQLVERSLSSPLGFLAGITFGVFAASIGFLAATLIMPVWLWRERKIMGVVGSLILLASVLVAMLAPLIQPTNVENFPNPPYTKGSLAAEDRFNPPSLDHIFGTDRKGQDIVTRIIYGSEVTVLVGLGTVILTAVLATTLGVVSGFFAGESLAFSVATPSRLARLNRSAATPPERLLGLALSAVLLPIAAALQLGLRLVDLLIVTVGESAALAARAGALVGRAVARGAPSGSPSAAARIATATDAPLARAVERATAGMPRSAVPLPNIDIVLQRIIDVWIAFPPIFLILAVVAIFGSGGSGFFGLGRGPDWGPQASTSAEWLWQVFPTTTVVMVTLAIVLAAGNTRVIRSSVLSIKAEQYVDAARSLGAPNTRIMAAHILPNVAPIVIILASLNLGIAVLAEAAISFLGYGIAPPYPTWGRDLGGQTLSDAPRAWWIAVFPGLAITIAVFGFNMLGDALRDVLDPRLRGAQ